ncbi:MAG: hypothetical protein JWN34_3683 [Bryobacterales bacterium]|nr:hypothetical protein [Bryobacterales bacterium]
MEWRATTRVTRSPWSGGAITFTEQAFHGGQVAPPDIPCHERWMPCRPSVDAVDAVDGVLGGDASPHPDAPAELESLTERDLATFAKTASASSTASARRPRCGRFEPEEVGAGRDKPLRYSALTPVGLTGLGIQSEVTGAIPTSVWKGTNTNRLWYTPGRGTATMRRLAYVLTGLLFVVAAYAAPPSSCADVQNAFDAVNANQGALSQYSWTSLQTLFGPPLTVEEDKPYKGVMQVSYAYPGGCSASFIIDGQGKVGSKSIKLTASAIAPQLASASPATRLSPGTTDFAPYVASLQVTAQQLQMQIDRLQAAIGRLEKLPSAGTSQAETPKAVWTAVPLPSSANVAPAAPSVSLTSPQAITATTPSVGCAENGSCYGDISAATGKPKTVQVNGYYRKDGTYVRGHVRSK